ncbi:Uncharacterised protein [Vibrio cholerae]|nr:Uncharacterised protein [Vibrio cholerae]
MADSAYSASPAHLGKKTAIYPIGHGTPLRNEPAFSALLQSAIPVHVRQ